MIEQQVVKEQVGVSPGISVDFGPDWNPLVWTEGDRVVLLFRDDQEAATSTFWKIVKAKQKKEMK